MITLFAKVRDFKNLNNCFNIYSQCSGGITYASPIENNLNDLFSDDLLVGFVCVGWLENAFT